MVTRLKDLLFYHFPPGNEIPFKVFDMIELRKTFGLEDPNGGQQPLQLTKDYGNTTKGRVRFKCSPEQEDLVKQWRNDRKEFWVSIGLIITHIDEIEIDEKVKPGSLGLGSRCLAVWEMRKEDPVAFDLWKKLHQAGVDAFHADAEKHAEWVEKLNEVWRKRKNDPVAFERWHEALMNATWRNNDWILNRTNSWYKVRLVPSVDFTLIVAGWEPRHISLILCLGIKLDTISLDHRNPTGLKHVLDKIGIPNVPSSQYTWESRVRNYYTDMIIDITGVVNASGNDDVIVTWDDKFADYLKFLGIKTLLSAFVTKSRGKDGDDMVLDADNESGGGADRKVEVALYNEVKCMAGSVKRCGIERDVEKWRGVVTQGEGDQCSKPLITLFYGETSLIVAWMNSDTDSASTMTITKACYW